MKTQSDRNKVVGVSFGITMLLLVFNAWPQAVVAAEKNALSPMTMGARAWQAAEIGFSLTNLQLSVSATVASGQSKTALVQICNGGTTSDTFRVKGNALSSGFKVTYLSPSGTNVTAQVVAGTYHLALNKGAKAVLKTKVNVLATATTGVSRAVSVTVTPVAHASNGNTVKFRVKAGGAPRFPSVLIPSGSFSMGNALSSMGDGQPEELPVHKVDVTAFYMDRFEVTKAKWDEVANWAKTHGYDISATSAYAKGPKHPVVMVTWYHCVKWCNARSEMEGLTPCYKVSGTTYRKGQHDAVVCNWGANGHRLPTEAEWEKAARGGASGLRFPWGNMITHSRANYYSSSASFYDVSPTRGYHPTYYDGIWPCTSPVGSFAANGYELFDMAGNVYEFCWDWYSAGYYATSPSTDPKGPSSGLMRVMRGGSWSQLPVTNRVASRDFYYPYYSYNNVGFRCVHR